MIVFSNRSIKAEVLEPNTGQIPGVPANPRKWTKDALVSLAKSIEETPELLAARRILVYPYGDKFVVLGGNMRLAACLSLGYDEMPCVVIEEPDGEISPEKLKEIVVKDNGSFGAWDFDMLKVDWGALPLENWGVDDWEKMSRRLEDKETAKLSKMKFDTPYYQPEFIERFKLEDCLDLDLFNEKLKVIEQSRLTKKQKDTLRIFAYRFIRIDFESVANYYAFQASDEEKRVIERLRLVLVDGGVDGFIEDGLLRVAGLEAAEDERE